METVMTSNNMGTSRFERPDKDRGAVHAFHPASATIDFAPDAVFVFGPFCLSVAERWVRKGNTELNLSSRALDILIALIARAGSIVSTRELFEIVWPDTVVEASNLRVHIVALRKALEDGVNGQRFVVNVPGRGYMFMAPIRKASASGDIPLGLQPQERLPTIPRQLFGRTEVIEKLSSMILSRRFVSVVGPGGVGKTAVAIAVAGTLRPMFGEDGICFLDLAAIKDPTLGLAEVLSIAPCPFDPANTQDNILRFLNDKRMLLVLDNCEHVIDLIAPLAARIFDEAPSVHILTTSREALRGEGENVELLTSLDAIPNAGSKDVPPAVELFLERAAAAGGSSFIDDVDAGAVMEICRRLDGLPIAIEIAASRVGTHGLLGIAELIEQGAVLFVQGRRCALPRQQTLKSLLDWSYDLLSTEEQTLLLGLSSFAGVFTLEAVLSLQGRSDEEEMKTANALANLVDKSLVQVSRSRTVTYYKLLHTTRAYCSQRLSKQPASVLRILHQTSDCNSLGWGLSKPASVHTMLPQPALETRSA